VGKLRIVSTTPGSRQAQANARGKLFEQLIAQVLKQFGYQVDRVTNVNYGGMEIDIEGSHTVTRTPLFAECKCYDTEVGSPPVQSFFGKYMTRWLKDKRSQGIMLAIPGINSHARAFYNDNAESSEITFRVVEEDEIIELVRGRNLLSPLEQAKETATKNGGSAREWNLIFSENGLYWLLFVIPTGSGIASQIAFVSQRGDLIVDDATIEPILEAMPELRDFEVVKDAPQVILTRKATEVEEIVEVRGSTSCFEYQFPASPEHFVGRTEAISQAIAFVDEVRAGLTSSRGIVFLANSGWGKSSAVLATVARLSALGHYAIAIDSRTCSSSQFMMQVVRHCLRRFSGSNPAISGFDDAVERVIQFGQEAASQAKVVCIFLDQFENVFFQVDTLRRLHELFLRICDARTPVILGFSWKTDLVGMTSDFPYQLRDTIQSASRRIHLDRFSEVETNRLLGLLSKELRSRIRADLRFFLSEFSQGYPWLLKKLCAHVKTLRESGVQQSEIANTLLNVEQLFLQDLNGLSPDEEDILRRVARSAPISVADMAENFDWNMVQSLLNIRLLVRVGNKIDIYWDIFRDYLNSNYLPPQENYILRMDIGPVLRMIEALQSTGGTAKMSQLRTALGVNERSLVNVIRDARIVGLIKVKEDCLVFQLQSREGTLNEMVARHLHDRLRRNRVVQSVSEHAAGTQLATIESIAELMKDLCPYISASSATWVIYARSMTKWMQFSGLVKVDGSGHVFHPDKAPNTVTTFSVGRKGPRVFPIQWGPAEAVLLRLVAAGARKERPDFSGMSPSTVKKALTVLQDIGFIHHDPGFVRFAPEALAYANKPDDRLRLLRDAARQVDSFNTFLTILEESDDRRLPNQLLGERLATQLGTNWSAGTCDVNAKILLDWARHAELVPPQYDRRLR